MPFYGDQPIFFLLIFFCFSFKNNRHKKVIWVSTVPGNFENAQKSYYTQKTAFLTVKNFFFVFKNTDQKNICASIVLKLNQSRNTKKIFLGGFSSKTQNTLFRGSKIVPFKSQISNLYFCVFFYVKGRSLPIFIEKC